MEHLVFLPDNYDPSETVFACQNDTLSMRWAECRSTIDFIPPTTPWLGFEHDRMPRTKVLTKYPEFSGWDVDQIWNGNLRRAHHDLEALDDRIIARRVASLLQAWLYYGLLETIVRKKVEVSYMMRLNSDDEEILYSRNLHFCLQAKVFKMRQATNEQKRTSHEQILEDLRFVQIWVSRLATWSIGRFRRTFDESYPEFMNHVTRITPAIVRLAEAISEMRLYALPYYPTDGIEAWHVPIDVVDERRKRMKLAGWCEFQIRLLEETTNQSTIDWFELKRIRQDPEGHDDCTPSACVRSNIDVSTYAQSHCFDCCQCGPIAPNLDHIMGILDDGNIPVVRLHYSKGIPQLSIKAMRKGEPGDYVAFSHVWVDGLGGSTEQGLLCCQVLRLAALASRAVGSLEIPTNFWIDSLCIPRSDKRIYYKALVGIRDVYLCASTVVVVDKLIQKCDRAASTEVLYAHIYMSAWMQRMWTYEEAVLAKKLLFVIKDGDLYTYESTTQPKMRRTVCVVWETLASQLFRLRADSSEINIGHVSRAFRWRLTNATQDEFMSVSSILGLDTARLEEPRGEDRTREFWLMLKVVPSDVPFLEGPKLSIRGFRWAPRTLMFPSPTAMDTNPEGNKCYCTENGLVGTYLLASLARPLNASTQGSRSVFLVLVSGDRLNSGANTLYPLRIYFNQTWPNSSPVLSFDAIVLPTPNRSVPTQGKLLPGLALLRLSAAGNEETPVEEDEGKPEFAFVGRIVVERLRFQEIVQPTATIMWSGSRNTLVDARGEWSVAEICIS